MHGICRCGRICQTRTFGGNRASPRTPRVPSVPDPAIDSPRASQMNSLVNPLTVWEMEGSFGLHPDVRQSRSKWKGFEATVRVGTVLGGDFWPLLSRDGETFASRLPTDAIELRGRVKGVERDAVRSCR